MVAGFASLTTAVTQQLGACPGADTAVISAFLAVDQAYCHSKQFLPKCESLVPGEWYLNRCNFVLSMCPVVSVSILFILGTLFIEWF